MLDLRGTKARMVTGMDADSEVLFKEKREEKGVKAETAGMGSGRVESKKFSLRPDKYDGKGDFDRWVNQFKEYAT